MSRCIWYYVLDNMERFSTHKFLAKRIVDRHVCRQSSWANTLPMPTTNVMDDNDSGALLSSMDGKFTFIKQWDGSLDESAALCKRCHN